MGWLTSTYFAHDPHPFCRGIRKGDQSGTCNIAPYIMQTECNSTPCISTCSLNKGSRQNVEKKTRQPKKPRKTITIHSWKPRWEIMASWCSKRVVGNKNEFQNETCALPTGIWMFSCFPGVGNRTHNGFS